MAGPILLPNMISAIFSLAPILNKTFNAAVLQLLKSSVADIIIDNTFALKSGHWHRYACRGVSKQLHLITRLVKHWDSETSACLIVWSLYPNICPLGHDICPFVHRQTRTTDPLLFCRSGHLPLRLPVFTDSHNFPFTMQTLYNIAVCKLLRQTITITANYRQWHVIKT